MDKEINLKNFFEAGTRILKEEKPSFNIFEMLGQSSREMTHSAFIAGLLNPKSNHGIGTKFLDTFLDRFDIHNFDSASADVIVEKDCGVEREENGKHLGGRIDIFLQDKNDNIIVIENKIYATDQDYQLERYWNSTDCKASIFYLTLDGHEPSKNSCGNIPKECYKCISYSEIKQWLADCMVATQECKSDISFAITHYMNNLDSLISDFVLKKFITQSFQNLRFALAVGKQADIIREKIREHFMDWFAEYIKEILELTDAPYFYTEKKVKIFTVKYKGQKLDFCLDHNIYVRLYKPGSEDKDHPHSLKEIFRKEEDLIVITLNKHWHPYSAQESPYIAWRYLELNGETINFYEFNHNAYLWLDNEPIFREELGGALKELFAEIKI